MDKNYSREEVVYLSEISLKLNRNDDCIKNINKFIVMNPKLNKQEQHLLLKGYKQFVILGKLFSIDKSNKKL